MKLLASLHLVLCSAAVLLFAASARPLHAQGLFSRSSYVPQSGEMSGNFGINSLTGFDNGHSIEAGFSGGVTLKRQISLLAEYNYLFLGANGTYRYPVNGHYNMIGGAVRWAPVRVWHLQPYGIFGGGYTRVLTNTVVAASFPPGSYSQDTFIVTGNYISAGVGTTLYIGESWGIRPEIRWDHNLFSVPTQATSIAQYQTLAEPQNVVRGVISLFYQFGGK